MNESDALHAEIRRLSDELHSREGALREAERHRDENAAALRVMAASRDSAVCALRGVCRALDRVSDGARRGEDVPRLLATVWPEIRKAYRAAQDLL